MSLLHTHKSQSFSGRIDPGTNGNRRISLVSEKYYQHFLNMNCNIGDQVTVNITNKKVKRTDAQNRYYWGAYLPLIAEETGERDLDRLHALFKGKFLTETIAEVLGEKVRITKSTSELNVPEFQMYIMEIENYTNITAPPTENYDLLPLRQVTV